MKQHVHSFFGGKGLGIQQGTSVWVSSPKLKMETKRIVCVYVCVWVLVGNFVP